MDVEQIIEKFSSRYKRLKTYQDAGILQSYSVDHASTMTFKTYFQAPSLYKFQWSTEFTWNEEPAGKAADKQVHEKSVREKSADETSDSDEVGHLEISGDEYGHALEPTKFGMVWANSHGVYCQKDSDEPRRKRNLRSALIDSLIMEQVAQRPMGLIFPNLVPRASCIDLMKNGVLKPRLSSHNYHRIQFDIPDGTLTIFIHAENCSLMRTITTTRTVITASDAQSMSKHAKYSDTEAADVRMMINEPYEHCFDCFYTKVHFDAYINEAVFTDAP